MKCSGVDRRSIAERSGSAYARTISQTLNDNPYPEGSRESDEWIKGFTLEKEALRLSNDLWKREREQVLIIQ